MARPSVLCGAVIVLLAFGGAPLAGATTTATCTYDAATHTVTANADPAGDALMLVSSLGQIELQPGGTPPVVCGAATPTNTDQINVTTATDFAIADASAFRPGAGGTSDSQIHWSVDLQNPGHVVQIEDDQATPSSAIIVGANGIALNSSNTVDIQMTGAAANQVILFAPAGTLSGAGGGALGGPTTATMGITGFGGGGHMNLIGGNGNDGLYPSGPSNTVEGRGGNDTINLGADVTGSRLSGGPGSDTVSAYRVRLSPLDVSLDGVANDGVPTNTTNNVVGVENLIGGKGADTLVGDAGPNTITGSAGNDTLTGGAGSDFLSGETGDDTINAKDGVKDIVQGGKGTDTATIDCGLDHLKDQIETVNC